MDFIENCKAFINDFLESKNSSICYLSVQEAVSENLFADTGHTVIDLGKTFNPLGPFLNVLRIESPSDDFLENNIVPFHIEIFKSFADKGVPDERLDIVVDDSTLYERRLFRDEFVRYFSFYCKGTYVVLNSQFMCQEAVILLRLLEKLKLSCKFIFVFNPDKIDVENEFASDFLESIKGNNNFLQYYDDDLHVAFKIDEICKNAVLPFETFYNGLKSCRLFLLQNQAVQLVNFIKDNKDSFVLDDNQKIKLLYEIALAYYYNDMLDDAILVFNNILNSAEDENYKNSSVFFLSKIYSQKKISTVAFKYAIHVERALEDDKESPFYALTIMREYIAAPRSNVKFLEDRYFEALKLLKERKLWNNYIEVALNIPNFFMGNKKVLEENLLPILEDCMKIAREQKNTLGLSSAYQLKGIIYSTLGKNEESIQFYNESLNIRDKIGEPVYIIRTRNGLSFEALIRSEYKKAYELLNGFVSGLEDIPNYRTIINTLRNLTLPLFYSHNFDSAREMFQLITNIIRIFNLDEMTNNSYLPEYNDIQIYKTFIDYQLGYFDRVKISLYNIEYNKKNVSDELYILLYFLNAALLVSEGKVSESFDIIDETIPELELIKPYEAHIIVFILYEYAMVLQKAGNEKAAVLYFNRGFEIAKRMNLPYYTKNKLHLTLKEYVNAFEKFEPLKLSLDKITRRTNKDRLINRIHKKIEDYRFLNKIMTDGLDNISSKKYIQKSIKSINEYFLADSIMFEEKIEDKWQSLASLSSSGKRNLAPRVWEKYDAISFKMLTSRLVLDSENNRYFMIFEKFGFKLGMIIYFEEDACISEEETNLLNIAIFDIFTKYLVLKQNEVLAKASDQDQLTKINNRRALMDYIENQSLKIKRYDSVESLADQMAFTFMDLDNFKFYNDTYGHGTGDYLLQLFSDFLVKSVRKVDFVCRYGGDEFVIVFKGIGCEKARELLLKIQNKLAESGHLIPLIEKHIGHKLDIPENRKLGFSAGLCSNIDIEEFYDLKKVIDYADKALYFSKKNRKGSITLYKDILQ